MTFKKLASLSLILAATASSLVGCGGNSDILATYKGGSVTLEELNQGINLNKLLYHATYGQELTDKEIKENTENFVNNLAEDEILASAAEAEKFTITDDEYQEIKDYMDSVFKENSTLKSSAEKAGLTKEKLEELNRQNILANKYYTHIAKNIAISEQDIEDYYNDHKEKDYTNDYADAAHILIKTIDDSYNPLSDKEKKEAKKKAESILSKIKAGEDFNKLAKEYSDDYNGDTGAELGKFYKGEMVPEFETAAFKLKKGEVSEIVESVYGYHIIKLNDKGTETLNLSQISSQVKNDLLQSRISDKIELLKSKYNLRTSVSNIDEINNKLKIVSIPKDTSKKDTSKK